jgi:hypothetical protein
MLDAIHKVAATPAAADDDEPTSFGIMNGIPKAAC